MILKRLYDEKLAQASYLVGCDATGEALVVDPNRDLEQYIRAAEAEGLRIAHVTETHIHADFVSGSRELSARTGAQLYLSDEGGRTGTMPSRRMRARYSSRTAAPSGSGMSASTCCTPRDTRRSTFPSW